MKEFKGTIDLFGYDGLYSVCKDGRVISKRKWNGVSNRELKQHPNSFGYMTVTLTKNKTRKKVFVHKIVAHHFIGLRPLGMQIRHLDGDKKNNHVDNLKYGTAKENASDRQKHNRTATGSKIGTSKLSSTEVLEIRTKHKKHGDMTKLAKEYGVSCANISYIIRKMSWKQNEKVKH